MTVEVIITILLGALVYISFLLLISIQKNVKKIKEILEDINKPPPGGGGMR